MAEGFTAQDQAHDLAEFLVRYPKALVLTGAGLSTASGYWARSMVGYPALAQAAPNPGHKAIAALEARRSIGSVLTQNVDGLHQQAGSQAVLELHGNIHSVVCMSCSAQFPRGLVQIQLVEKNPGIADANASPLPDGDAQIEPEALEHFHLPGCLHCGRLFRRQCASGPHCGRTRPDGARRRAAGDRLVADGVLGVPLLPARD
jgi:NAD-dependent SIR2 family protein deacetylase